MRSYILKIAGYNIMFSAVPEKLKLRPSPSQLSFITPEKEYDLVINVSTGTTSADDLAMPVFRAPYVEEINGVATRKSDKFWTVYTHGDYFLVSTTLPLSDSDNEALLTIRPEEKSWDLVIDTNAEVVNPFSYPLDGLILYYITAIKGDILIHGSGVEYNGRGYLFSGQSGKGKTTIARIFMDAGARVIHDDRLVIRQMPNGEFYIFNTPVYENEESRYTRLDAIYLIDHGDENISVNQGRSESLAAVMANCIQHNWNRTLIGNLTGALLRLVTSLPVKKLLFVPGSDVIDYIEGDG